MPYLQGISSGWPLKSMGPQALSLSIFSKAAAQTSGHYLCSRHRFKPFFGADGNISRVGRRRDYGSIPLPRHSGWLKTKITYPRTAEDVHGFERHPVARFPLAAAHAIRASLSWTVQQ
jgi:hypothetical protein